MKNNNKSIVSLFLIILIFSLSTENSSAGLFSKVGKEWNRARERYIDPVGDRVEREVRSARDKAKETAKKIEKEIKRNSERIEKVLNSIKDKTKKIAAIKKEAKKAQRSIKKRVKSIKKEFKRGKEKISALAKSVSDEKNLKDLTKLAVISVIHKEIKKAADEGKIEDFLNTELIKHVRVIDLINPTQGVLEKIDPTGIVQCTREGSHRKLAKKPTVDPAQVTDTVFSSSVECLDKNTYDTEAELLAKRKIDRAQLQKEADEAKAQLDKAKGAKVRQEEEIALQEAYKNEIDVLEQKYLDEFNKLNKLDTKLSNLYIQIQDTIKEADKSYQNIQNL